MRDKTKASDTSLIGLLNDKDISIPKYQRKFKWDLSKQRELIDSIKKDYPIGVITTYIENGKIYILDGLQRLSTVRKFIENPASIFTWTQLMNYGYLDEFNSHLEHINLNRKKKNYLIKKFRDLYETNSMTDFIRISTFINHINSNQDNIEYSLEDIEEVFHSFKKIFEIEGYRVAVITYEGDTDQVADIFEKMNTGSILLSKYEVYAASWTDFSFKDEELNEDIIKYSNIHYKSISESISNIEIDYSFNDKNIAEILIGLSYKFLNEIDSKNVKKVIPKVKTEAISSENYLSRNDVFHQIIASLTELKPNNINNFINKNKTMLLSNTDDKKSFINFIYEICEKIIVNYKAVEEKIMNITDDGVNNLDYLFYYVNSVLFFINYDIDEFIVKYRNIGLDVKQELLDRLIDKDTIISEDWFKNKNRQVSFVNEKISFAKNFIDLELKKLYK